MRAVRIPVRCTLPETVKKLRTKYNCVGIKTSFEDEGASPTDVLKLRTLTAQNGLKLVIKVGGAEAKTDIKTATDLCCDSIVGPMIETKYALEKYAQATRGYEVTKGVNLETITALNNIELLLTSQALSEIDYFVIGRVDLIGSLGQSRDMIDSDANLKLVENAFTKVKKTNKTTYLGGALSRNSKNFIKHLYSNGLLDYIETRFIIMKLDDDFFDMYDDAICASHEFELKWSEFLYKKYVNITTSLSSRITMIKSRVWRSFVINNETVCYNPDDIKSNTINIKASPYDYTVKFIDNDINSYIHGTDCIIIDRKLAHLIVHDFVYTVDAVEENKTIDTVMDIIKFMSFRPVSRVVVIGGGLVQDIGAFASSIFNRGTEWIYFPTTLLSMADSCIGSKTSLNTTFKNKIGTFNSPRKVYINTGFLDTLEYIDIRSGMGEILKLCMIGDALGLYENYKRDITSLIKLSLIIKKAVIETDQYDEGIRRALNYGHTIGHAVEIASGYAIPHGIAVIMGMMTVNRVFGYSDDKFEELCKELLNGTSASIQGDLKPILLGDKKATQKSVCFIVPKSPGKFSFETKEVTDVLCSKIKDILA